MKKHRALKVLMPVFIMALVLISIQLWITNQAKAIQIGNSLRTVQAQESDDSDTDETSNARPVRVQRATNVKQLREMIQARVQTSNQEAENQGNKTKQKVFKNQNAVRDAVHTLLSMEDLTGGIGPQVSAIAQEFNNSIDKTIQAEEQIQKRNRIARFFMGGLKAVAQELQVEVVANQNRIEKLRRLEERCNCSQEIKDILQEQIQNMQDEQERLQELSDKEIKWPGVWGWLKKIFKKQNT